MIFEEYVSMYLILEPVLSWFFRNVSVYAWSWRWCCHGFWGMCQYLPDPGADVVLFFEEYVSMYLILELMLSWFLRNVSVSTWSWSWSCHGFWGMCQYISNPGAGVVMGFEECVSTYLILEPVLSWFLRNMSIRTWSWSRCCRGFWGICQYVPDPVAGVVVVFEEYVNTYLILEPVLSWFLRNMSIRTWSWSRCCRGFWGICQYVPDPGAGVVVVFEEYVSTYLILELVLSQFLRNMSVHTWSWSRCCHGFRGAELRYVQQRVK